MKSEVEELIRSLSSKVDRKYMCWKYTPSERSICQDILELEKEFDKQMSKDLSNVQS